MSIIDTIHSVLGEKHGVDLTAPLVDRIKTLGTPSEDTTTPIAAPVIRDNKAKKAAYGALNNFPFTDEAKAQLRDLKYKGIDDATTVDESFPGADADFNSRGKGIYDVASKILPGTLSAWLAKKGAAFNAPSVKILTSAQDPESVMSHEMLHDMFETSPMGNPPFSGKQKDPAQESKAGRAWLAAWDSAKKVAPGEISKLAAIDQHLADSGYDPSDAYSMATERFAYLGQQALKKGIEVIPPALRPYYYGVIKGAPKPTAEQLGANLPADGEFGIDIPQRTPAGRRDGGLAFRGEMPLGAESRTILDKVTGKTTVSREQGAKDFDQKALDASDSFSSEFGDVPIISRITNTVGQAAAAYGVDPKAIAKALITENANLNPNPGTNKGGDSGMFQVNKMNEKDVASALKKDFGIDYDSSDPEHSALAAAYVLGKTQKTLSAAGFKNLSPEELSIAYRTGPTYFSIAKTGKDLSGKKASVQAVKQAKQRYQQRSADLNKRIAERGTINP